MIRNDPRRSRSRGFTLIESVVVILLIGVLAAVSAVFIVEPFQASNDMIRRAELVESTETALDRITREVRLAVPNSIRVKSDADGTALELLRAPKGGRYRRLKAPGGSGDPLNRALASDSFDVLGGLGAAVALRSAGRDCASGQGDCVVIANTGTAGFDAYDRDNIAAITAADNTGSPTNLTFNTGGGQPAFPSHSPNQRFQLVDTVVSYICDAGEIRRHFDYGLNATQTTAPGGADDLLAEDVAACDFDYDGGAGQRHGLVTIDLRIERGGETVRLVDQAHVVNVP